MVDAGRICVSCTSLRKGTLLWSSLAGMACGCLARVSLISSAQLCLSALTSRAEKEETEDDGGRVGDLQGLLGVRDRFSDVSVDFGCGEVQWGYEGQLVIRTRKKEGKKGAHSCPKKQVCWCQCTGMGGLNASRRSWGMPAEWLPECHSPADGAALTCDPPKGEWIYSIKLTRNRGQKADSLVFPSPRRMFS